MERPQEQSPHDGPLLDTSDIAESVDRLCEQVQMVWKVLDEIRQDLQRATRNATELPSPSNAPPLRVTSMPIDPCDPHFGQKLNRVTAADIAEKDTLRGARILVDGEQFDRALRSIGVEQSTVQPGERVDLSAVELAAALEGVDQLVYCCESPELQWSGEPDAPSVVCRACGYVVAEYGEVVDDRPEERSERFTAPPTAVQGRLWNEDRP